MIIIDLYKTLNIVSNLSEPFVGLFTLHKILIFFSFEQTSLKDVIKIAQKLILICSRTYEDAEFFFDRVL